jgi:ankyrin repeat protein
MLRALWMGLIVLSVGVAAGAAGEPLVDLVKAGDAAAVRAAATSGTDVRMPTADGTTLLHWAAYYRKADVADVLLRAGANPNAANRYAVTPLLLAAEAGSLDVATLLLKAGADATTARPSGETALMLAARHGNPDLVRLLVSHGADVNARERTRGETALMYAAVRNHGPAVKALLDAGADPHVRSHGPASRTPSGVLAEGKTGNEPGTLRPRVDQYTAVLMTVRRGATDALRVLLENGGNANDAAEDGMSALVLAAVNAKWDAGILLLEHGADPNADKQGWTALHQIARTRSLGLNRLPHPIPNGEKTGIDFARALLAHGAVADAWATKAPANVDQERTPFSFVGSTPFLVAAKGMDVELMRTLVEGGADPSTTSTMGSNAMMLAAGVEITRVGEENASAADSLAAVKYAYELGIDINAQNYDGNTALHGAAFTNAIPVIDFLIEKGAAIDVKNWKGKGWTPLATAHLDFNSTFLVSQPEAAAHLRKIYEARGIPIELRTFDEAMAYFRSKNSPPPPPAPPAKVR